MIDIVHILNNDGVIVVPTDTIVGFSCDVNSSVACNKIQNLKKRDGKPFIVIDSSLSRVKQYFKNDTLITSFIDFLIQEKIWPNNLTLIYYKNPDLNYSFLKNFDTIAVRLTDNKLLKEITNKLNSGITSTSINLSGEKELNNYNDIFNIYHNEVDYIYPFTPIEKPLSSTIIQLFSSVNGTFEIKILREGNSLICEKLKNFIK